MGGSTSKKAAEPTAVYDVLLEEWPSGFVFEGNVIKVIDRHRKIAELVEVEAVILGVNGDTVDENTFADIYDKANAKGNAVTLTVQRPVGGTGVQVAGDGSKPDSEVSKSLLIDILLCYFGVFIDVFGITVTGPVMPFLQPVMGFTDVQLGLVISSYNIACIPGALIIGNIMRARGTRTAALFSLLGSSVTMVAQGLLLHMIIGYGDPKKPIWYGVFIAIRVVAGLTGSSMPVAMTFVGMKVPQREKPKYMALTAVAITMAVMFGPLVGGTTAQFSPVFALPFYLGGILALFGFAISLSKLGDARPPKQVGKGESMPKAVKAIVAITSLKMLAYSSYIMLGPAYYIWRFNMLPSEVGALVSLHGVYSASMAIFVMPRLMSALGPEGTFLFGACVMTLGMSIVGFMPSWWSFQMVWSPLCGLGFSCLNTGTSVVADRFATQSTRSMMNSSLFIMDQIGSFLAGLIYGQMLEVARENDAGYIFWFTAAAIAGFYALCIFLVWRLILIPAQRASKDNLEMKAKADHLAQSSWKFEPDPDPTEAEYLKYGKYLVDLLHSRKYSYMSRRSFVERVLSMFFSELPTDTLEHRMDVIWEKEEMMRQFGKKERDIDDFYAELGGMANDSVPDVQRAPTSHMLKGPEAKKR